MQNIIHRNNSTNWEVVDILIQYKFEPIKNVVALMESMFGVVADYLEPSEINERFILNGKDYDSFVLSNDDGAIPTVYLSIRRPKPIAQLQLHLPYKQFTVIYLSDANFRQCKFGEKYQWDYYIMFSRYMWHCVQHKASDFHLDVSHSRTDVTYPAHMRIGQARHICDLFELTREMNKMLVVDTIRTRLGYTQAISDLNQGYGLLFTIGDVFGDGQLQVRLSVKKVLDGYMAVCRLQTLKTTTLTLDSLDFDPQIKRQLREGASKPSGLSLLTGKMRTGKTTTLNAIIEYVYNRESKPHIMSLDDPIEIMGKHSHVDYKGDKDKLLSSISDAKTLDLDYVVLNEVPNARVAEGVRDLVNSSIHTITTWHMNRIWHLPYKMVEYFNENYRNLISQINMVCNQRLYQKQCPHCLAEVHRSAFIKDDERIVEFLEKYQVESCLVSQGCEQCQYTKKQRGKVVVIPEILTFSQDLVFELFSVEKPYDMERVLFKTMLGSPYALEAQLCKALKDGRVAPEEVLTLI